MKHYIAITQADPFTPDTIFPCDTEEQIDAAAEHLRDEGLDAHPVLTGDAGEAVKTGLVVQPADEEITDEQILALRSEAGSAGDVEQVALCDLALGGDKEAIKACAEAVTSSYDYPSDLHRYSDGEYLREATEEERLASDEAAESDGGAGVIIVEGVRCYVAP